MRPSVSSLYRAVELQQEIPPLLVGERANTNGSKKFRELLLADDYDSCLKIILEQEAKGAHVIDVCTAYAGRDEREDLTTLVRMCAQSVKCPLVIDSTTPACIEACLKMYPGRVIVNSVNLEDGGKTLRRICLAAKKYGAAVVALTINEQGMAMTAGEKLAVAREIYQIGVHGCGLRPQDLIFDCLTFTVGSGDENLEDAAIQTLEGIRLVKAELPGCLTILGLSNISFGLPPKARRILNSVFLHEAVQAGLDAAIVDAAKILPFAKISEEDRDICRDLLFDRKEGHEQKPLMRFIAHFQNIGDADEQETGEDKRTSEEQVFAKVVEGDKEELEDLLAILMEKFKPLAIINQILVPAMRHVGELFGRGEILLPFVLQSAEVMKQAVTTLEPFMDHTNQDSATSILLATVQGDVHDIGKNLVDIILSNNGYRVYNIGINVPTEMIIEKARELKPDLIGLSGLLVKSAIVMQESMSQYRDAGIDVPIMLGGAALTPRFVADNCVPAHSRPVVYCPDAFAGLKAVRQFEEGELRATVFNPGTTAAQKRPGAREIAVSRGNPVPEPPFWGQKYVDKVDPEKILPLLNTQALFRGRWGYRRAKMSAVEYQELITGTVEPLYERIVHESLENNRICPKITYGYFPCYSEGETLCVEADDQVFPFPFPRQKQAPHRCIADFFKTKEEGGDVVGFFVVSIGEKIGQETARLYKADAYHEYLLLHGFSVEITDALAEYWHAVMRGEMGINESENGSGSSGGRQSYQGSRYGFGYPACPDLDVHTPLFAFLKPEKIGITLTENMQMVPEQTTSAIVVHHPQATYFAV